MKIGTKSILFGVHSFVIHPWFVALAWAKLYGFPWDPRLWAAFFLHDIGYFSKPNMDGPEGERHPVTGALVMSWLFDGRWRFILADLRSERSWSDVPAAERDYWYQRIALVARAGRWHDFTLLHSRHFAKLIDRPYSRLCVADKYSTCLTPAWLYLPMAMASGELAEYMANGVKLRAGTTGDSQKAAALRAIRTGATIGDARWWLKGLKQYMRLWVAEHKDGKEDVWTKRAA